MEFPPHNFFSRLTIFLLASLSFACLLGTFYGLWGMKPFACLVLVPATLVLAGIAVATRNRPRGVSSPCTWIVEGALAGVAAAVIYDLFRLPFVLNGYPLFAVFPKFGQMLLGAAPTDTGAAVQVTGWAYHFSNGAALGIMFLAMVATASKKVLFWGAVAWAVVVEILLLATPYYSFFDLRLPFGIFLALTLSAHIVFGVALGLWFALRLGSVDKKAETRQVA